jgi:serine phosphatase RsbU (regulator of sigma subunit)
VGRADGSLDGTGPGDLPLGVMRDPVIREREVALGPGDTLILYSDGLTDALPEADSANKVIRSSVAEAPSAPALADRLATIARSEGTPIDDVTVAVLRRLAAGTP